MLPGVDPGREFRKKNTPLSPPLLSSTTLPILLSVHRYTLRATEKTGGRAPLQPLPQFLPVLKARPPKKECMTATKIRPDLRLTMMVILTIFSVRWKHKKGKQTILTSRWDCLFHFCRFYTMNIDHHFRRHQKIHTCAHDTSYWLRAILAHFRGTTPKRLLSFEIGQI